MIISLHAMTNNIACDVVTVYVMCSVSGAWIVFEQWRYENAYIGNWPI